MAFFNAQSKKCDFCFASFFNQIKTCLKNSGASLHRTQAVFQQPASACVGSMASVPAVAGIGTALFVPDLIVPDVIPFVDEVLLGLITLLTGRASVCAVP